MNFTRDGSAALEQLIAEICQDIGRDLQSLIPADKLQALVLGGGYGRGEGGVLATPHGDAPYNDLEFFILIAGEPRLNERRYGAEIHALEQRMTQRLGIDVEFKILSREKLEKSPASMFYYDLVSGHRVICGSPDVLAGCAHHADASRIPLHEATRLFMNRCSGLLFAAERLRQQDFTRADADFTARNIAKAQLAMGDVVLTALGCYHWSCMTRHDLLTPVQEPGLPMAEILAFHQAGVAFKLHPSQSTATKAELDLLHGSVCRAAWAVWAWLEERRLGKSVASPVAYGRSSNKCPETFALKNALIRLRTFGPAGVLSPLVLRYPREALLNTLPLLLWAPADVPAHAAWLSRQLVAPVTTWSDAVSAYARLWARFN